MHGMQGSLSFFNNMTNGIVHLTKQWELIYGHKFPSKAFRSTAAYKNHAQSLSKEIDAARCVSCKLSAPVSMQQPLNADTASGTHSPSQKILACTYQPCEKKKRVL